MASSSQAVEHQRSMTAFACFLVAAGLINALIAALLLCITPKSHVPSLISLLVRATVYVVLIALAGIVGSWLYWRRSTLPSGSEPPLSFSLFALTQGVGWVWVPSIVLLWRRDSPLTVLIAAIGAASLAAGLRKTIAGDSPAPQLAKPELFAESLADPPLDATAFLIAICIYLAVYAIHNSSEFAASALLSFCAFAATWRLILVPENRLQNTQALRRLVPASSAAVLTTFIILLAGVRQSQNSFAALNHVASSAKQKYGHSVHSSEISGYESVILWPVSKKKLIVAPPRASRMPSAATKPVVIPFNGQYWYYQAPHNGPGSRAHVAHGDPLVVNVHSGNFFPLTMAAHQDLGNSTRLSCCREIQVTIQNSDNKPGAISLAVLLTDSLSPGEPTLYLGQQAIVSTQPGRFSIKSSPIAEMLRFPIPGRTRIRRFDGMTVVFLPDVEHSQIAPKIAIRQFELLPRN